jgi:hypothetical protein
MAINPNTNFAVGQVLTADQTNRFPRGIVADQKATTNFGMTTAEAVSITASTFTAVANRTYKITYYEPAVQTAAGAGNFVFMRIRLTNASGTIYNRGQIQASGATQTGNQITVVATTTFTAGSVVVVGTLVANTGTPNALREANSFAYILVEDIGPA